MMGSVVVGFEHFLVALFYVRLPSSLFAEYAKLEEIHRVFQTNPGGRTELD
jgi:hypothetical protein